MGFASGALADWRPETVAVGVGVNEVFADEGRRVVYQAEIAFPEWRAGLAPVLEANFTGADAVFVGAGLTWRWEAARAPLGVRVGVAPGYYEHGDDKLLGGGFQIMSFIEGTCRVGEGKRTGLRLTHLSNASTKGRNPGTELLAVFFEMRFPGR
jgi:hypothetical protein